MKIIVAGDGKVGYTLSDHLSQEGHDVTIIDNKTEVLEKTIESLDVRTIKGNAANIEILLDAGVKDSDVIIAVTSRDELNILCCLWANKLSDGRIKTIARMRDPEYGKQQEQMTGDLGIDMIVNPEEITAIELSHLVSFPSALSIGLFADAKVYMLEYQVEKSNPLAGLSVSEIHPKFSSEILVSAICRQDEIYIPGGDFVIQAGDHLFLNGEYKSIKQYFSSLRGYKDKIKSVILVGGGLISHYLAQILIRRGVEIKIIEKDADKCQELSEKFPQALIIMGDGTDKELLDSEGLNDSDALISLTNMDEENLLISLYAAYKKVPNILTKINRSEYTEIIQKTGINRVVTPKYLVADHIVRYVRSLQKSKGSEIETLYRIIGKSAEVVEFIAGPKTKHLGQKINNLPLKKDILITTIVRNQNVIIPKGNDIILEGDHVIVTTTMKQLEDLNQIFAKGT